ncbi:hypothetical protein HK101_009980 [Irineochytrium annulatum]|nr:hypothetical protein HK101_009980 [Irineochytrium annulatum]
MRTQRGVQHDCIQTLIMDDASASGPNSTQPPRVVPNRGASDPVRTRAKPMTAGIQTFEHCPRGDSAQDRSAATADLSRDVSAGTMADGADATATGPDFLVSQSPSSGEMRHRRDVGAGAVDTDNGGVFDDGKKTGALAVYEEEPDSVPFGDDEDAESLKSPKSVGKSLTFGGVTIARAAALKEDSTAEPFSDSWLLMTRMPLVVLLLLLVVLTNTQWWMSRPSDIVFMQQLLTAAVGLILGVIIREFTFMAQGALAATWVFGKHKSAIPVAEAIQFGNPALLINSRGASPFDVGIVVMLPLLAVLFNVIYKFGIVVGDNASPWTGLIRTIYLNTGMDTTTVMTATCQNIQDLCKPAIFQPKFSFQAGTPSLSDFSYAPGVEFGKQTGSGLGYRLIGGDVPSIDDVFKRNVGGMSYKQVYLNTTVDCSHSSSSPPWITSCPGGVHGLSWNVSDISNLTYCPPVSNVVNVSMAFQDEGSLGLSCLLTSAVWLRDVVATPFRKSWSIKPSSILTPLNASTLVGSQVEHVNWFVKDTLDLFHKNGANVCFGSEVTGCRNQSSSFVAEVAAALAVSFSSNIYWFLHNHPDDPEYIPPPGIPADHKEPLPGRLQLKGDGTDPWVEVWGPEGVVNLTATPNTNILAANYTSIPGAYAGTMLIRNQYVAVRSWLLVLLVLPLMELVMAFIKFMYRSHAYEPICGFVWTIRKVNAEVAADANGLGLRQVLAYARNLKLDWKDEADGPPALSLARSKMSA